MFRSWTVKQAAAKWLDILLPLFWYSIFWFIILFRTDFLVWLRAYENTLILGTLIKTLIYQLLLTPSPYLGKLGSQRSPDDGDG